MRENKYARKLVFDRCTKINTREINRCPMREIKSARKLVRIHGVFFFNKKDTFLNEAEIFLNFTGFICSILFPWKETVRFV